jgi:hypothetical protein
MTTVGYFHNGTQGVGGMAGAPNLSGTAGSMIAVLDACLVDGWGSGTVDSVVISGGIATVTRAAGHPFDVDCVAELAGATTTGGTINGRQKVLSAPNPTTYTFATALANQTATGTITHKVASLGWGKAFSGTNLAAYRSSDVAGTRMYLRVDDSGVGTGTARVVGYESMSDISTGTGPFPTNAQVPGGGFWARSSTNDAAVRDWVLVGDSRMFYLWVRNVAIGPATNTLGFGDYQSNKAGDALGAFLAASTSSYVGTTTSADLAALQDPSGNFSMVQPRGVSGLGSAQPIGRSSTQPMGFTSNQQVSGSTGMAFPNPANNEVYVAPITLYESSPLNCYRGVLPGAWFCPMTVGTGIFAARHRLTGVTGLSGRVLRTLVSRQETPFFVDVTGPWAR